MAFSRVELAAKQFVISHYFARCVRAEEPARCSARSSGQHRNYSQLPQSSSTSSAAAAAAAGAALAEAEVVVGGAGLGTTEADAAGRGGGAGDIPGDGHASLSNDSSCCCFSDRKSVV